MESLLRGCLGAQFEQLSPLVRQAHEGSVQLVGDARVERGNLFARLICNVFGMPPQVEICRLIVRGEHYQDKMTWNRHFNDHAMNSSFYKQGEHLIEKLGPIHMTMHLSVEQGALIYTIKNTKVFGIPIPRFISPYVRAVEMQEQDYYRFKVVVALPVIGKLVSYFGDMQVTTLGRTENLIPV